MGDLFQRAYYLLDLGIGFGAPLVAAWLWRTGRMSGAAWRLFWVGAIIGLAWEVPFFALSALPSGLPVLVWVRPPPVHWSVLMLSHTLWDAGLFLLGVGLVHRLCRPPAFARFRGPELGVLLVYGQIQELLVEISSTSNSAWVFVEGYWWNPTLFYVNGFPVTLLPQLVWLAAPVAFYLIALRVYRRPPEAERACAS